MGDSCILNCIILKCGGATSDREEEEGLGSLPVFTHIRAMGVVVDIQGVFAERAGVVIFKAAPREGATSDEKQYT